MGPTVNVPPVVVMMPVTVVSGMEVMAVVSDVDATMSRVVMSHMDTVVTMETMTAATVTAALRTCVGSRDKSRKADDDRCGESEE